MTDDLIERLRHPVNGMRPTLTDGRAAADALTAAQARIAELEAHMNDALFAIALNLSFCPRDLEEAQQAVVHTGRVADRLRSALFPDQGEEHEPFTSAVRECGVAIEAAHERGRLQGLDEAVEVARATEERCLRQRGDGPPLNAIDRENRLDWYNRSRGAKMTAESIIALKTKGESE